MNSHRVVWGQGWNCSDRPPPNDSLAGRPAGRSVQRVPPPELPGAAVTRHPTCVATHPMCADVRLTSGGRKPEVTVSTGPCLLGSLWGSFFALRLAPGGPGGPGRSSAHRHAPCSLPPPRGLQTVCPCVSIRSLLLRTPAKRLRPTHIRMVSSKHGCICKDLISE